jgi:phosphoglycerol transferase MdoB-like AlkP superfamily enzyme
VIITTFKNTLQITLFSALAYGILCLYIDYSHLWVALGHRYQLFNDSIYYYEIPFAIALSCLIFFPSIKNKWVKFLAPIIPILILYALFDTFYDFLGRAPHPSDLQNATTIFEFSIPLGIAGILFMSLIPIALITLLIHAHKACSIKTLLSSITLRLTLVTSLLFTVSSQAFTEFHQDLFKYTLWSQEFTIRVNGKLSSFIYYANEERKNRQKLLDLATTKNPVDIQEQLYPGMITTPKNIHIIVLESFIDPRLIPQLTFNNPILADELRPFLNSDKDFSHITTSIYGGSTAQSEFEVLTGVKALSKVNQIEFNVMQGEAINGFINRLQQNDYRAMATIAPSTSFFNSKQAYKSLGLTDIEFLEDEREARGSTATDAIFDGDLLEQNLLRVKKAMSKSDRPIVNYVLGMYGHYPYERDHDKRPDVVAIKNGNRHLWHISNQFYYRTKALGQHLKALTALDKDAIILITSDHLPSVLSKQVKYQFKNTTNIALLIHQGKSIDITGKHLHELPWLLWDLVVGKSYDRNLSDDEMSALYFKALSESLVLQ